jgi:hypothetical protein
MLFFGLGAMNGFWGAIVGSATGWGVAAEPVNAGSEVGGPGGIGPATAAEGTRKTRKATDAASRVGIDRPYPTAVSLVAAAAQLSPSTRGRADPHRGRELLLVEGGLGQRCRPRARGPQPVEHEGEGAAPHVRGDVARGVGDRSGGELEDRQVTATGGLFALVYGFSNAQTQSWGAPLTVAALVSAVVLLVGFVVVERRSSHPLLPLRVVTDRARGGSYLAVAIVGAGMFGVFLPIQTGLAFLPMIAVVMVTATLGNTKLVPRSGPRRMVSAGMLFAAGAMLLLTRIGVDSSYATHVLPAIMLLGLGLGLVMAPSMNTATQGVQPSDAGVASAMVNTGQQVGGSVGTALLSTLAASAATSFVGGQRPTAQLLAEASVHGYVTAFWWSAGIFAVGAVVCGLLLPGRVASPEPVAEAAGEPVFAH